MTFRNPSDMLDDFTPFEVWKDLYHLEALGRWQSGIPGWAEEQMDAFGAHVGTCEAWARKWLIEKFIEDPHNLEPIRSYLSHVEEMAADGSLTRPH